MERVAIVVRLKAGSGPRAAELIAAGPPFDLGETGIVRHSVYLSASEVVFVFEGHQVEWMVDDLINDPFRPKLQSAFEEHLELCEGCRAYLQQMELTIQMIGGLSEESIPAPA